MGRLSPLLFHRWYAAAASAAAVNSCGQGAGGSGRKGGPTGACSGRPLCMPHWNKRAMRKQALCKQLFLWRTQCPPGSPPPTAYSGSDCWELAKLPTNGARHERSKAAAAPGSPPPTACSRSYSSFGFKLSPSNNQLKPPPGSPPPTACSGSGWPPGCSPPAAPWSAAPVQGNATCGLNVKGSYICW